MNTFNLPRFCIAVFGLGVLGDVGMACGNAQAIETPFPVNPYHSAETAYVHLERDVRRLCHTYSATLATANIGGRVRSTTSCVPRLLAYAVRQSGRADIADLYEFRMRSKDTAPAIPDPARTEF